MRNEAEILADLQGWRDRRAAGTITGPEFHEAHNRLQGELAELGRQARRQVEEAELAEWQAQVEARQAEDEARRQAQAKARREKLRQTDSGCPYKTLKDAYADGWLDIEPDDYGGERLTLKGHDLTRNGDKAVSETEWKRRGFTVKAGEEPHGLMGGYAGNKCREWYVYRRDQVYRTPRQQALADRREEAQRIEAEAEAFTKETGFELYRPRKRRA